MKFDHQDVYFLKHMKGVEEYSKLISEECLNDIELDGDLTKKKHDKIVRDIIKNEFVEFMKL